METTEQIQFCGFFAVFDSFCKDFSTEVREREARSPVREGARAPQNFAVFRQTRAFGEGTERDTRGAYAPRSEKSPPQLS